MIETTARAIFKEEIKQIVADNKIDQVIAH
jgi:hypothetical protein